MSLAGLWGLHPASSNHSCGSSKPCRGRGGKPLPSCVWEPALQEQWSLGVLVESHWQSSCCQSGSRGRRQMAAGMCANQSTDDTCTHTHSPY